MKASRELQDNADVIIEMEANAPRPATLPSLGGVAVDDVGDIWIGVYDGPGVPTTRWWKVLSPAGVPIGRIELPVYALWSVFPARTEILAIAHGRIALLRENGDGELAVEVRALVR